MEKIGYKKVKAEEFISYVKRMNHGHFYLYSFIYDSYLEYDNDCDCYISKSKSNVIKAIGIIKSEDWSLDHKLILVIKPKAVNIKDYFLNLIYGRIYSCVVNYRDNKIEDGNITDYKILNSIENLEIILKKIGIYKKVLDTYELDNENDYISVKNTLMNKSSRCNMSSNYTLDYNNTTYLLSGINKGLLHFKLICESSNKEYLIFEHDLKLVGSVEVAAQYIEYIEDATIHILGNASKYKFKYKENAIIGIVQQNKNNRKRNIKYFKLKDLASLMLSNGKKYMHSKEKFILYKIKKTNKFIIILGDKYICIDGKFIKSRK